MGGGGIHIYIELFIYLYITWLHLRFATVSTATACHMSRPARPCPPPTVFPTGSTPPNAAISRTSAAEMQARCARFRAAQALLPSDFVRWTIGTYEGSCVGVEIRNVGKGYIDQ